MTVRDEKKAQFTLTSALKISDSGQYCTVLRTGQPSVRRCNYLKCGHLSALFLCGLRYINEKEKNNSIMFMEVYNN